MGSIANLSDFINRATGGNSGTPQDITVFKAARVGGAAAPTPVVGRMISLWRYDGNPTAGAVPGAVPVAPTSATAGSIGQASPGGGRQQWLTYASVGGLKPSPEGCPLLGTEATSSKCSSTLAVCLAFQPNYKGSTSCTRCTSTGRKRHQG